MASPHDSIPAAGWYPDPELPDHVCYWDGAAWDPESRRPGAEFEDAQGRIIQGEVLAAESVPLDQVDAAEADAEGAEGAPEAATPGTRAQSRARGRGRGKGGRGRGPEVFIPSPRQEASGVRRLPPAPLPRRFLARLTDLIVPLAVGVGVAFATVPSALDHLRDKMERVRYEGRTETVWLIDGTTTLAAVYVLAAVLAAMFVYEVIPTWLRGRSVGKTLFGLRVVDVGSHKTPELGQAVRRWLVLGLPGLLVVGLIGVVRGAFDLPWRQGWHDLAANTFVGTER
ncbi:RDD family protein [Yinghuangia sp. ASG 101]|uniref:RDD family protein n=1 Tax=Yinghuangia sp. ASG 101 TaxID=2896848 RepID=UPI001E488763|nr:RDD family protein [Yinghuangia sp. ASG 101]UGQ09593.1 RDD family protein [Yinghuangia sp. ASG 101]